MSVPPDYLEYPKRRYGMDHERYLWSMLPRRDKVRWPGGARVALMVVPALEWFPLDMTGKPFKPPGAMVTPYPDLRHYTLRDYGNRVGVYRVLRLLDELRLRASWAINSRVAVRYPSLLRTIVERGDEVVGDGIDMVHQCYEGKSVSVERS